MGRSALRARVGRLQARAGRDCALCGGRGKVTVSYPDDGDECEREPCPSCGRSFIVSVRYDKAALPGGSRAGIDLKDETDGEAHHMTNEQ